MTSVILDRGPKSLPTVVADGDARLLLLRGGADALGDARRFTIPISAAHLAALEADFGRHVLLWGRLLPLAYAAGNRGDLDETAASALVDTVLLGSADDVDAACRGIRHVDEALIRFGADAALVEKGDLFAASRALQPDDDYDRLLRYRADSSRADSAGRPAPLDAAVLTYLGRYPEGGGIARRIPAAVDPALLPDVEAVVAVAERATAGMRISTWGFRKTRTWDRIADAAAQAVRAAHPELSGDAVAAVADLVCTEAAERGASSGRG